MQRKLTLIGFAILAVCFAEMSDANDKDLKSYADYGCACDSSGGWTADIEFTVVRFAQEGGVTDATGSTAQFGYDTAPRFAISRESAGGLGMRFRMWEYSSGSATSAAGNLVAVDAYNIDFELYQNVEVDCNTDIELALGLRYLNFDQSVGGTGVVVRYDVKGFGGTLGVQARRHIAAGNLYARARWSIAQADAVLVNIPGATATAQDSIVEQTEIGFGYELARESRLGLMTFRVGAEWQNWANVAIGDTTFGGVGNDDVLEDAGFAGLVFGVSVQR